MENQSTYNVRENQKKANPFVAAFVFRAIVEHKRENDGISPSYREIVERINHIKSVREVRDYLDLLEDQGKIETSAVGRKRYIKVVGARWIPPPDYH